MPLIEVKQLQKHYDDLIVLNNLSLAIEERRVIALIGQSGSGKSTLLRTLNGLQSFDSGTITVDGIDLHAGEHRRETLLKLRLRVGMVFQRFNLFPHLTATQNVSLALRKVKGFSQHLADTHAKAALARVQMDGKGASYPSQLSGGQQQRVAIARAIAMEPKVLLCDEITSALDPELTSEVLDVLRSLAADGMTLIMATHEMGFAREISDLVVYLRSGIIHESGPPGQIFSNPATPELARFIRAMPLN